MILLVDDNPDLLRPLELLLSVYGYEVGTADSGHAALAKMSAAAPHCVILDYHMPEMDGMAVLRAIRAERRYDQVHVVLFTADDRPELRAAAAAAGADAFVRKGSLDFAELERVVRDHCRPRRAPRPAVPPVPPERAKEAV
ncbi:MAG TPA: response regulator [Humisphaera sp.]